MNPKFSIIIRVRNEADNLKICLERVAKQKQYFKENCQVIVIDNESSDATIQVAKEFGTQIIELAKDDFNYPLAMNLGIQEAKAPICIFLSAHSYIFGEDFFEALDEIFANPQVAGAWGPVLASFQASIWERLFYNTCNFFGRSKRQYIPKYARLGSLGATNCAVRTNLAIEHPFDLKHAKGGEDFEWAGWALNNKYLLVRDFRLAVEHSHGLSLLGFIKQYVKWMRIIKG